MAKVQSVVGTEPAPRENPETRPVTVNLNETVKEPTMNRKTLAAAFVAAFAASGAAFADGATYDYPTATVSGKTRADVQKELFAARADGSIKVWSTTYNPLTVAKSLKTRDEVKAERADATMQALHGEDSGSFALSLPVRQAAPLLAKAAK